MTILPALDGYYNRLAAQGAVPPYGYSRERISYALILAKDGRLVDVQPLLDTSGKKPRPRQISVPQAEKRTSGIASNFLWDKTSYVLGVSERQGDRIAKEHEAFKSLHETWLAETSDEGLRALHLFLNSWKPQQFGAPPFSDEMLDTNLVFRLDGEQLYLHDRPAAQKLVADRISASVGKPGLCLVTGQSSPITRLHPAIKGVRGAQSSGASVVSFNLDAFESFGKSQGENAPVSERAAFGYGTALNKLLEADSPNRLRIGDTSTVFWAETTDVGERSAQEAETLFAMLADPPTDEQEARKVADALSMVAEGRPIEEAMPGVQDSTRFYVLGLSPNASRLSIRFWYADTIGTLARRIGDHWRDLLIKPRPWTIPPAILRLLYETAAQRKAENIPPLIGGALTRSILAGGRYPQTLLAAVIMRMRADRDVNGLRAAICKACLARDFRLGFEQEDVPVSLDLNESNPAYRLGRLFAVYEGVQRAALGRVNATIKDRYFGAASATPASIFPMLERNSVHHLSSLRKGGKGGLAHWFEQEIDQILSGLDATAFPRSLNLQEQGRFALGYHQQRSTKRSGTPEEINEEQEEET